MNLQSLPTEIVQPVAREGGEEIENLRYSNRYFHELFLDSHMKKEITPVVPIPKFPFNLWTTRMFFVECFQSRNFQSIVDFFNEEDLNLYKDDMLYLCIRFMYEKDVHILLSKIKLSFIKPMTFRFIVELNEMYKRAIKYLQDNYSHLFCGVDDPIYCVQTIDQNYTIGQLYSSLISELNTKKIELQNLDSDPITEKYKYLEDRQKLLLISCRQKFMNFVTEEQKSLCIMAKNRITFLLTLFLINGNSLKQNFNTEEIKTIEHVIGDLYDTEIYLIMKYCSIEEIKELLETGAFLNEENVQDCVDFLKTLDVEKMNLFIEKMATFSNKNFRNVLTLISDSIEIIRVLYHSDVFLSRTEQFISSIPFEMIKKILSLDLSYFEYYRFPVNSFYLLVRYVKENENIKQESKDISSLLNIRIKQALNHNLDILVKHIYSTNELNFMVLYLYCFDEQSRIDDKNTKKILSILKYIYTITRDINIFNRSMETFGTIRYKLFEDRRKKFIYR